VQTLLLQHRSPLESSSPGVPVNFTIYYPPGSQGSSSGSSSSSSAGTGHRLIDAGQQPAAAGSGGLTEQLPALFMLNGGNVEARHYSQVGGAASAACHSAVRSILCAFAAVARQGW
jgi:hypothetical protein